MKILYNITCNLIPAFVFWVGALIPAKASHFRAGEITTKNINALQYEITLTTYSKISAGIDVSNAIVYFGDGTNSTVNILKQTNLGNDTDENIYKVLHTYNGSGQFIVSFHEAYRNGGIVNMLNPSSTDFYIETLLEVDPFLGVNNSPQFST